MELPANMIKDLKSNMLWKTEADFDRIYNIYYPKLVRFANTYLLSFSDSENIVQDIFLRLWENRDQIPCSGSINAYLFTVVKNRCVDTLRTVKKERFCNLSGIEQQELNLKLYALEAFDENGFTLSELERIIQEAILSLPDRCREIFLLSRMEGLTYKEISERLEISTNTIEGQMSAALRKLRVALKDYLPLFFLLC